MQRGNCIALHTINLPGKGVVISSEDKMTRNDSFPGSISNSIELNNISLGQEVSQ